MREWEEGRSTVRKYGDINKIVWEWFCTARSKNMPVTGRLIQEKALKFSLELRHNDFSASNGRLDAFKRRILAEQCSVVNLPM